MLLSSVSSYSCCQIFVDIMFIQICIFSIFFIGKYSSSDQGKFKSIVTFDCRGIEPVEFSPSSGWVAKIEESSTTFQDVDLSEKEWVEYDDKISQSVGVYELESQFIKVK